MTSEMRRFNARIASLLVLPSTRADLAKGVGVTRQTIVAIERGRYSPSLEMAILIAGVFEVPLGDVFQSPVPSTNQGEEMESKQSWPVTGRVVDELRKLRGRPDTERLVNEIRKLGDRSDTEQQVEGIRKLGDLKRNDNPKVACDRWRPVQE